MTYHQFLTNKIYKNSFTILIYLQYNIVQGDDWSVRTPSSLVGVTGRTPAWTGHALRLTTFGRWLTGRWDVCACWWWCHYGEMNDEWRIKKEATFWNKTYGFWPRLFPWKEFDYWRIIGVIISNNIDLLAWASIAPPLFIKSPYILNQCTKRQKKTSQINIQLDEIVTYLQQLQVWLVVLLMDL